MSASKYMRQIHPFPARMAPELALAALQNAPRDAVVLDPMCGSGTVLRHARERGMSALGYDIDPLAVLIARVACTRVDADSLRRAAAKLILEARRLVESPYLPWLDSDPETRAFVSFWFYWGQQARLRRLASLLHSRSGKLANALRVALSRTIITKDAGASRARDVSHSRPHRVQGFNRFDVYAGFQRAVEQIAPLLDRPDNGRVLVARRDARRLPPSLRGNVDLVVTSPPYLNAIDYMRGHRLSLVWLGYGVKELRHLRSNSVGAERAPDASLLPSAVIAPSYEGLSSQQQGMLNRYAIDSDALMGQIAGVLSARGEAVVVAGDSTLSGTFVHNSVIIQRAAERHGLVLLGKRSRSLPTSSRYLPPPSATEGALAKRMRCEIVMRFAHSAGAPRLYLHEQI